MEINGSQNSPQSRGRMHRTDKLPYHQKHRDVSLCHTISILVQFTLFNLLCSFRLAHPVCVVGFDREARNVLIKDYFNLDLDFLTHRVTEVCRRLLSRYRLQHRSLGMITDFLNSSKITFHPRPDNI